MAIVNERLMSRFSASFNVGADILGKGSRRIEKGLGASNMSGDTVSVTIMDSGKVFKNTLDISGSKGKLGVNRGSVPVKVRPIGVAAEVSAGDLTLAIEQGELMGKRVAGLQDEVNKAAYRTLLGCSQAFVATDGLTGAARDQAYRQAAFDAEAYTTTSKFSGSTFGIAHPQTWNRVVPSLMGNYGAHDKIGGDLYKNELGDFLGFRWTKGADTMRIVGVSVATDVPTLTINTDGRADLTTPIAITSITGMEDGELCPYPLALTDGNGDAVECVDALGKPTGIQKTVMLKWNANAGAAGSWELAQPLFFRGPRKNAHNKEFEADIATYETNVSSSFGFVTPDHEWYPDETWNTIKGSGAPTQYEVNCTDVLTAAKTYLAPMVMWKEPDFLIAVKGIETIPGTESFTVPTEYSDKGIMPWRGSFWGDGYSSVGLFRVDALMGFGAYQGCSMASVYIPID